MATTPSLSQHAPSPAPSHPGGLDEGFQQLQEFNKSVSVESRQDATQYPDLPDYYAQDVAQGPGGLSRMGGYGHSATYDNHVGGYRQTEQGSPPYGYSSHYSTPPLTTSTEDHYDGIRTRSGRSLGSPSDLKGLPMERIRNTRSPRVKKPKATKTDKSHYPQLDMVLSELVKEYPDVEAEDMETYVSRPPAERQLKAQEKKRATPPRPMNSFMLYRHCYAGTIKKFLAGKGNHQQVSYLAGKSWGQEPNELRAKFQEYADLEKEHHKKAFPNYHFKPKKDQSSKKRKKTYNDDDDEPSDFDDLESWGTPVPRSSQPKRQRRTGGQVAQYHQAQPRYYNNGLAPPQMSYNKSSFQASNPSMTPPVHYPYGGYQQQGEYFERTTRQAQFPGTMNSVEDIFYTQQPLPVQSQGGSSMIALPGSGHSDLFAGTQSQPHEIPQYIEPQLSAIDPSLQQWASREVQSGQYDNFIRAADLRTNPDGRYENTSGFYHEQGEYQNDPLSHPGEQTLTASVGHWEGDGFLDDKFDDESMFRPD